MITKTKSEIQYSIIGVEIDTENGVVGILIEAKNPYNYPCSVKDIKFEIDGVWFPATIYTDQEVDFDEIPLSGRMKRYKLNWDAAGDLRVMQSWNNLKVAVTLNDRAELAGVDSETQEYTIPLIDFTVTEIKRMVFPYSNDPYFDLMFVSKKTCRPSLMNFLLKVATDENFTNIVKSFDTREDQTGWTYDEGAFPENGIPGESEHEIIFASSELAELSEGNYYIRITPIVTQFYVTITSPYDGQVFVGGDIDIEGTVTVIDN